MLPILTIPLLALAPVQESSADWPNWRGPLGCGRAAPEADPPIRWSEEENVAWKTPLPGHGKSTPIVHDGHIFLLAAVPTREATEEELAARPQLEDQYTEAPDHWVVFLALALSLETGEVLWETELAERLPVTGTHDTNGYASFSPVTDGEGVFFFLGSYGVHALEAESGEPRWSYELGTQRTRRGWGEGGSPALAGEGLIVVADQEENSRILCLDKATGKVRWERERDEISTWTTPLLVDSGGSSQVVVNGTRAVRSYDPDDGELLWWSTGQTVNAIPTPVTAGGLVVCTSGYRGQTCKALVLAGRGDLDAAEGGVLWSHDKGTPYVSSPLLVDDRVYMLAANSGRLSCVELATGKVLVDRQHLGLGNVYASPMEAAGRIYVVGRDGTTVVLRHGEELEVLATNNLDDPIDATPVAIGRRLLLRSDRNLYALEER